MIGILIMASVLGATPKPTDKQIAPLLKAIRKVETGGQPNSGRDAVGDKGKSIGPYQIQYKYWKDSRVPGNWTQCRDPKYAERVMIGYWQRHCPKALKAGDAETLSRTHNGGPHGAKHGKTQGYWNKVKKELKKK